MKELKEDKVINS